MAKWAQDQPVIQNPYWEAVKDRLPKNPFDYDGDTFRLRTAWCRRYSWAIPDPAALAFVARWLAPQAVEMGAGTGLWASLLTRSGVEITAYDERPPDIDYENVYHSPRQDEQAIFLQQPREVFYPVQRGFPEDLAGYADRPLFLCWPPYNDDMATLCLDYYAGNRIVYIGEGNGGCNGNEEFWERLAKEWHVVKEHAIKQWPGIHDGIVVYERGPEQED